MKALKQFISIIIVCCVLLSTLVFSVAAASAPTIHFSANTVEVGDNVTVTVSVNPEVPMYAVFFYLNYNDSILKYNSGPGVGSAGTLQVVEDISGENSVSYNFTFTAVAAGTSSISVSDCVYSVLGESAAVDVGFGGASASITVKDLALSDNANLSSLNISGVKLSPSFSASKTKYTAKVLYETTDVNVTAIPADNNAKVTSVSGNKGLKVGKNTITVTVEAQNGTTKQYTITLTRLNAGDSLTEDSVISDPTEIQPLLTTVAGSTYTIVSQLPQDKNFEGFTVEKTTVKGHEIETAVDNEQNFRIFYLKAEGSEDLLPYLYDEQLDEFERLKHIIKEGKLYIFSTVPQDYIVPETLYKTNVNIGDFSIECLTDTNTEMSDFYYLYCFSNGNFNLYRYDSVEGTLQRYPDFKLAANLAKNGNENIFTRFASLSKNGKVIIISLLILIFGIIALLVLLIVYLIKKSLNRHDEIILSTMYDNFDEIREESIENSYK